MHAFMAAEHLLSNTCFLSPNPAAFILLRIFLVDPDNFSLRPALHRLGKYVICIEVDGYHDIAIAVLGCVRECTILVGVDLFIEILHVHKYVVELGWWEWAEG